MGSKGKNLAQGTVAGTGASLDVICGFRPDTVRVHNRTSLAVLDWTESMGVAAGYKLGSGGSTRSVLTGSDIKGSVNTDSENTDAAALPTNGSLLKSADVFSTYTSPVSSIAEPDVARNVGVFITNDSGGALDLFEGASVFTITGTYKGAAQTEAITITSTSGNKSVANTKFRYKYGAKPFDTVTSVAYTNAPAATLKLSFGIGSKIGLPVPLFGAATASVEKITKNAADLSPSGIVDTTNNTVNLGTLADNDDFQIVYKVGAAAHSFITTLGITPFFNGFTIGADTDVNVNTDTLYWTASKV